MLLLPLILRKHQHRGEFGEAIPRPGGSWQEKPQAVHRRFNGSKLLIKRDTRSEKGLPVDLTEFVVPGTNNLEVAHIDERFHLAVEILETLGHSAILEQVCATGVLAPEQTL